MATEDDLGPRLSGRLTYRLKRALVDLESLHEQHLGPAGITARELAVLLFLDGREPESQQQAAARLGIDRTTMVGLLDSLERKNLVARRPDAGDRRRNVVVLTDAGRATAPSGDGRQRRRRARSARRARRPRGRATARTAQPHHLPTRTARRSETHHVTHRITRPPIAGVAYRLRPIRRREWVPVAAPLGAHPNGLSDEAAKARDARGRRFPERHVRQLKSALDVLRECPRICSSPRASARWVRSPAIAQWSTRRPAAPLDRRELRVLCRVVRMRRAWRLRCGCRRRASSGCG